MILNLESRLFKPSSKFGNVTLRHVIFCLVTVVVSFSLLSMNNAVFSFVQKLSLLLQKVAKQSSSCQHSLWRFNALVEFLRSNNKFTEGELNLFLNCLKLFTLLSKGLSCYRKVEFFYFDDFTATSDSKVIKSCKRFVFMLWSFVFFTSQKIHFQLDNFFFLLHYRGLSYSGFYLFKQMGLYLHPRSLKKTFEKFVLCH